MGLAKASSKRSKSGGFPSATPKESLSIGVIVAESLAKLPASGNTSPDKAPALEEIRVAPSDPALAV